MSTKRGKKGKQVVQAGQELFLLLAPDGPHFSPTFCRHCYGVFSSLRRLSGVVKAICPGQERLRLVKTTEKEKGPWKIDWRVEGTHLEVKRVKVNEVLPRPSTIVI